MLSDAMVKMQGHGQSFHIVRRPRGDAALTYVTTRAYNAQEWFYMNEAFKKLRVHQLYLLEKVDTEYKEAIGRSRRVDGRQMHLRRGRSRCAGFAAVHTDPALVI